MVIGLVLPTHVIALHIHREHIADFLYPIGVVNTADESRTIEHLMALRIGEDVEYRLSGRGNRTFYSDLCVVAHTPTLPKVARYGKVAYAGVNQANAFQERSPAQRAALLCAKGNEECSNANHRHHQSATRYVSTGF